MNFSTMRRAAAVLLMLAGTAIPLATRAQTPGLNGERAAAGALPAATLEGLAWLGGCWRRDGAETGSGEQWLPLAGGTLLGVNRHVRQGVTVGHEFMQIRRQADGSVAFIALPAGRTVETVFTLLPGPPMEATFENPEHDFPQRVIYRLGEGGKLRARIEGHRAGAPAAVDFAFTRAACDAQPALPEAFQGLPWGADETQIALRFGPALKRADCSAAQRRALRPREACNHPVLASYPVAGVPFRLHLHVDETARQLVRVSLQWSGEGEAAAGTDRGWSEKHRQLRQLLTQRYGGPENTHVDSDGDQHSATARWRRGETMIELRSTFRPPTAGAPANEQVGIVYLPVTAGDAGKL